MKYLYLLRSGEHVKIGVANDLEKRLKGIATGNPQPVTVISYFSAEDAPRIESLLHERFAKKRHKLEWFKLDDDDIKLIETICEHNGAVKMPPYAPRKKLYGRTLESEFGLFQTVLSQYVHVGGDVRLQNVIVAGKPATAVLLIGVFYCKFCKSLYLGAECPKCPPVQQPAP